MKKEETILVAFRSTISVRSDHDGQGQETERGGVEDGYQAHPSPLKLRFDTRSSWRTHLTKIREEKDLKQSVVKNPIEVIVFMEIQ